MPATQENRSNGKERTYDFAPFDFDVEELRPIPEPGKYQLKIKEAKIQLTSKEPPRPMLVVEYEILEVIEGGDANSITLTTSDFFPFHPKGDAKGDYPRERLRGLLDLAGIPRTVVPMKMGSIGDFEEMCEALKGAEVPAWIVHKEYDGETKANVEYKKKGAKASGSSVSLPVDEEMEEAPKKTKASDDKGKKPAQKSSRR